MCNNLGLNSDIHLCKILHRIFVATLVMGIEHVKKLSFAASTKIFDSDYSELGFYEDQWRNAQNKQIENVEHIRVQ